MHRVRPLSYYIEATVRDFQWSPHSKKRGGENNTPRRAANYTLLEAYFALVVIQASL